MKLKVIENEREYEAFLAWIDEMFDKKVSKNTEEGEMLQVALLLVKTYEDEHYAVPMPEPIAAIKAKMIDNGLKNKDLVGLIGSKGYVSAILNKRKPLTLEIAKIFHQKLGIPANILLS